MGMGRNGKQPVWEWEWSLFVAIIPTGIMGKALCESHGNGNWLQNREWEWEGMGIDCTGMGGSGNVKSHSRASLLHGSNFRSLFYSRRHII